MWLLRQVLSLLVPTAQLTLSSDYDPFFHQSKNQAHFHIFFALNYFDSDPSSPYQRVFVRNVVQCVAYYMTDIAYLCQRTFLLSTAELGSHHRHVRETHIIM